MIPLQYAYFTGASLFLIPWIILYKRRKDLQREMIVMGAFITIAGILSEYFFWTHDWWRPHTITNTIVGFEDIILGFSNGGIAAVLYEEVFRRKLYKREPHAHHLKCLLLILFTAILMAFSFWGLGHSSFVATTLGLGATGLLLLVLRRDLLVSAFINGLLMAIVAFSVYYILMAVSPEFIEKTWLFNHLTNIRITGILLEDVTFYFLVGFVVAPLYEYWQCLGLRKFAKLQRKKRR